ncbi:MAG: leucine-rich repeat protein, partial [Clostridia bacterium]|nr:leucine-rich repeat protein [Clostridia bacterium]
VKLLDYLGDATEIVIPSEIGGLPVTVISNQAFAWLDGVTSITIPDTVEIISYEAFAYNDSLAEITIPASVAHMSGDVFYQCTNLQNIYCASAEQPYDWSYSWSNGCNASIWFDGVLSVGIVDGFKVQNVDGHAAILDYVGNATEIVIPAEIGGMPVVAIEARAFANLYEVTSIVIPDSVCLIGHGAFADCTSLTEITIPASVEFMHTEVFCNDTALQNIYCEATEQPDTWDRYWTTGCDANIWFDGVLTQGVSGDYRITVEDGEVRITDYLGSAAEIVIPSELGGMPVTSIGYSAFSNSDEATSITIPDSVTEIASYAFAWCYALTEITIPASVKWVEYDVFYECNALQNIYCEAESQPDGWSDGWTNGCSANIYFDGVLTQGVIDDFRISITDSGIKILRYLGLESEVVIPFAFGDLPVICIGNSAFSDLYDVTAITIPESVTEIESYAFARCYELTEITIPASVAVIGDEVFWECSDLQNIYCETATQPFGWSEIWANGCNANVWFDGVLTQGTVDGFVFKTVDGGISIQGYVGDAWDIVIPAEIGGLPVTRIESYAFAYRYDTTSVSIPDGVTYIGSRAFAENYALAQINIPDSVKEIGGYAFVYCNSLTEITIPASVEIMGARVFRDCYSIQNIYCEAVSRPEKWNENWSTGCSANIYFDGVMTQGVSGNYQFKTENGEVTILDYVGDAYGLTELVIPSEIGGLPVTVIGSYAFSDLYEMKSVSIPDSVHTIEYNAFAWCGALTEVTIPASVTIMGSGVFWDCQNLQSIYCEAAEPTEQWDLYWTDGCNANLYFDGVLKRGVVDGYLITTENGEVAILDCAGGFGGVTELVIPSELCGMPVTTIASSAFAGMSELTGIIIPDSVHTIYDNAFAYCVSLKEITIPASVKQLSYYLFDGCTALENIYCEAASRPDEWNSSWANGCDANVWFDGVLTRGTVGDYVIIVEEGAVTILAYTGSASVVEIPSELNGLPVVGIGNSAFADMDHLTEVIIPDSVMSIGYEAFAYCDGLTEMTIPESVLLMDADVFWNSTNIENIYCEAKTEPEGWRYGWVNACNADVYFDGVLARGVSDSFCFSVKDGSVFITGYLGSVSELVIPGEIHGYPVVGIASGALSYREDIESVVLPASLRYIEGYAFEECHSLSSVVIPDGVVEICDCAFGWCYQLTEITIPASVTVLGGSVFVECNSLQNIYCEAASRPENWNRNWANGCDANIYFDGVLIQGIVGDYKITAENGEVTILEYVGSEAQVRIPAEIGGMPVTSIGRHAFAGFDGITEVIIPDSVASIGYEAFAYCNGLTEMTIPASVLYMDDDVFWDSRNLQNIYCKAASCPEGWSYGWDSACGANIYFDGVLAKGVVGDYRVEFEDGNTKIVGYLGIESELEIPAEIEGKPVTYIGYEAFAYNENLISVTIPASVTYMGGGVFYDCLNLQNIYCEAEEEPDDWNYNWTNGCNANVYYDGVLLRGVAEGCKFFVNDGVVILTDYVGTEQEVVIPAEITGLPVVSIEAGAFANCDMTSVVIPDGVEYIGYDAFANCNFLKEITIPASVMYMDGDVFWNCDNLQTIYCESGEHIAEWSFGWFGGCNAEIYVEGVLTVGMIGDYRVDISGEGAVILDYFGNDTGIVVPAELGGKTVVEIGSNAFAGCYYLTEITIPASVVYIGSYAFSGSEELKNIYLAPDADIESWSGNWYINCEADVWKGDELITAWDSNYRVMLLESGATILDYVGDGGDLIVPETLAGKPVVQIGRKAFDYLDNLTSIVLPDSIVSIGDYAFNGCYSMQSAVLPKKLESIGYSAFCDCASLTEIVIPGTVTYIADEAFVYCRSLEKVVLQKGVLDIGYGAFAGCTALQSIVLPSTLLSISSYAFAETALTEITIPKSVEYVGGAVFAGAESLETIYCEADDIGYWEPHWLNGCDATAVWGVVSDEECLYGDVNGDGKITGMDVTRLLRYIANRNPVTGESSVEIGEGSDCNGDGKITGMDVTRLLRYIANRNPITGESSVTLGPSK